MKTSKASKIIGKGFLWITLLIVSVVVSYIIVWKVPLFDRCKEAHRLGLDIGCGISITWWIVISVVLFSTFVFISRKLIYKKSK